MLWRRAGRDGSLMKYTENLCEMVVKFGCRDSVIFLGGV